MKLVQRFFFSAAILTSLATVALPASAQVGVGIRIGPPPPRYEVVPGPRPGYYWHAGHWHWNGYRYVWAPGYWAARPVGYVGRAWVPGHYVHRPMGWFWIEGHWV